MSFYPTVEDMKVEQAMQQRYDHQLALKLQEEEKAAAGISSNSYVPPSESKWVEPIYPPLNEYMGLNLQSDEVRNSLPLEPPPKYDRSPVLNEIPLPQYSGPIAPISSHGIIGYRRAEVKPGIRSVILCKNATQKLGLRIKSINKGIFITFVSTNSPAAIGGLRFGDQILQINNLTIAGYSGDKVMKILRDMSLQRVEMAIRDRPFERTVTLQKDNTGHVGFLFKNGKIVSLVQHSSAARNGILTNHHLCEVNGQCVVGMKDKNIEEIMFSCGKTATITIMPSFIYNHIVKNMGSGLLKIQDHSIPEL